MALEDFKHRYEVQLRFSDFDMLGHVNNARFLTFMEDARIRYLEQALGQPLYKLAYASIVAHLDVDYKVPVVPYDTVHIYTRTVKTGDKSLTLASEVVRFPEGNVQDPVTAALCQTVLVTISRDTGRPISHPQEMLKGIRELEGA